MRACLSARFATPLTVRPSSRNSYWSLAASRCSRRRLVDLSDVTNAMLSMLRRLVGKHIEVVLHLSKPVPIVRVDPGQIQLVLMNLVVNARDACPEGGTVTVETARVLLDEAYAADHPGARVGPHAMLAVTDAGGGIPPDVMERMFEPFFTTKEVGRGTGLGLATVQSIVEQAGGNIWVYSELSHGTTFKVYLPEDTPAGATVNEATPSAATPAHSNGRADGGEGVLLVEDDPTVRHLTSSILLGADYVVRQASNGVEALGVLAMQRMNLVLSDMIMPAMGGTALAAALRERFPGVPIVLMSGYTRDGLRQQAELSPLGGVIEKPFTPAALLSTVRETLDKIPEGQ